MKNFERTSKTEELQGEIVIIGGGGSGVAAAVAAAENGAKVIVIEKRGILGGNSAMARGLFATETRVQEQMRLFVTKDEVFKVIMSYSRLEIDPRIIRAFLDKSGDTIRWLEEKGIEFDGTSLLYYNDVLPVWHCPKQGAGERGGAKIVEVLVKDCKDLGVQFFLQTTAKKILKDEKRNVTGVLAATGEKEFVITAQSVIIATGGHGSNKELLKKYHHSYTEDLHYTGIPLTGDGLIMAAEIGANTDGWGTFLYHGPQFPGGSYNLRAVCREPYTIWVNKRGERYVDEGYPYAPIDTANALDRQPSKVSYTLFDEKIKQRFMEEGVIRGNASTVRPGTRLIDLRDLLNSQAEKGWVKISSSWDEIAGWIGTGSGILKSTIDNYNRFCDQGYDKDFLKDRRYLLSLRTPPYYAMKCIQTFLDTIGGIAINYRMEVLDHDNEPIRGLYAVGVTTGGWEPKTYCIKLAGNAFGFAINSGRIAGENAVKYVREKN
jgi:fumarate reductase flavoprotein subunit